MIGAMTYGQFAFLSVLAIAFICLAWRVRRDGIAQYEAARPRTLEQEDEHCRDAIALVGQHHPSIGSVDDEPLAFMLDNDWDARDELLHRHLIKVDR